MKHSGRHSRWFLAILPFVIFGAVGCGPVNKTLRPTADDLRSVKTVGVVLENPEPFTVLYDRAKASSGPALMFGLIGAAVASSYNASLDNRKIEAVKPHLIEFSTKTVFDDALVSGLRGGDRFTEVTMLEKVPSAAEASRYDALVTLRVPSWGLRLATPSGSDELTPFVELKAVMKRTSDNRVLWEETDTFLGQARRTWSDYERDGALLRGDLAEAWEAAGQRTANKLVYP